MMLVPGIASAQTLPEPVAGDKAIVALQAIFGKLFGGMTDALGSVNETYLGYVLIVGGIIACYTLLSSILMTAHHGEMMGKPYSSLWVPIKYALGVALILPINQWCVGQQIVANLIKTGIGAADQAWSSFVSSDNLKQIAKVNIDVPNVRDLTYKIYASQLCVAAFQSAYDENGGSNSVTATKQEQFGITVEDGVINKIIMFGDKSGSSIAKDACGRVEVRKVQFPDTPAVGNAINYTAYIPNVASSTQRMLEISNQHWTQVNTLISTLQASANKVADNVRYNKAVDIPAINTELEAAAKTYRDAIYDTASSYVISDDAFKPLQESAKKDGFIMAGAWPITIYSYQEHTARTVANLPSASGPTGITNGKMSDQVKRVREVLENLIANSAAAQVNWGVSETEGGSSESWSDSFTSFWKKGMDINVLAKKAFSSVTDMVIVGDQNILLQDKRIGNWALTIAGASWLAGSGISAIPLVGPYIADTIKTLMQYILAVGFFLSYLLPMIPFLIWFGAIFGFFVSCIEAIFIVPAWVCITFLDPSGGSFVASSAQGYKLLLQLLLRPLLMVLGLIGSIMMIDVVGKIINTVFAQIFLISQADSSFIIFIFGSVVAFPLLYGAISLVVAMKSTALCHVIPDQMITWLLNGSPGLGGHAESMGGAGSVAANSSIGGAIAGAIATRNQQAQMASFNEKGGNAGADAKLKGLGALGGASNIAEKINPEKMQGSDLAKVMSGNVNGIPTQRQTALSSRMEGMNSFLDKDSQIKFQEAMVESINTNEGFTDEQHMDTAFKQALNNEYGAGAGAMIKSAGGGSYDSEGAKEVATMFKQAKSDFQSASPYAKENDFLKVMSNATAEAKDNFINDKGSIKHKEDGKNLNQFMGESINRNLNLNSNQEIDTTPMKKEEPKDEAPKDDEDKE